MSEEQYYRLELNDVATPSFTSFGKNYYGTMVQVRTFIKALEDADYLSGHSQGLIAAFYAYESGQTDVKHSVAYRDVPLLVPVTILHEETHSMTDLAWEHMNIWRTWLKIAGTCGLLGAAITVHAIYNLLIAYGSAAQYIAYLLPVLILTVGKLISRRLIP